MQISTILKPYLPKSLLGRSLLIIVTPLFLLQVVSATIFFQNHWSKVGRRLALGVGGEIGMVINSMRHIQDIEEREILFNRAMASLQLNMHFEAKKVIKDTARLGESILVDQFTKALDESINKPHRIDAASNKRFVHVQIQLAEGVLSVTVPRKRLFSTSTYVFVLMMVGTSVLLFFVAMIFMRNQVRPIRKLAEAADDFGKGRDTPRFKPEGASEVRRAAGAFISMRNRIKRQIQQRTDMLAGVSHDLRTPLTRMKLQLAMMNDDDGVADLKTDIADMEHMLEEYLAFVRGEGEEKATQTNITDMLSQIAIQARRKGGNIDLHCEVEIIAAVKTNALKRSLTNFVDNAVRYGGNTSIRAALRGEMVEIVIDDDGPGIPEDKRDEVFKPFVRLDASRNPETGGVGLGMTIARDAIRSHGGEILLEDAPGGGLRVRVSLPV
ncbi:MAG: two-component sensor histidine kinase [Rhodospirillaceae bacterium]|nr:MAG: two-component sensor histidine kinase [Rhodospirillaceae bacterium]